MLDTMEIDVIKEFTEPLIHLEKSVAFNLGRELQQSLILALMGE